MPNKMYIAGYQREQAIKKFLEHKGYICFGSRGSHSEIDLIGIDVKIRKIHLIQSKKAHMSGNAIDKLLKQLEKSVPSGNYYVWNDVLSGDWASCKKEMNRW